MTSKQISVGLSDLLHMNSSSLHGFCQYTCISQTFSMQCRTLNLVKTSHLQVFFFFTMPDAQGQSRRASNIWCFLLGSQEQSRPLGAVKVFVGNTALTAIDYRQIVRLRSVSLVLVGFFFVCLLFFSQIHHSFCSFGKIIRTLLAEKKNLFNLLSHGQH